ncbi:hypothetical protein GA0061099_1004458 [Bradyrhizobium yuanmingense]|uniref:Uncharacterized protein n=1 Tax=Bradyrhizobium yuanmingense TaxID=108015 RepID=A0A1C3VRR9_9BRAD|nr:hypothetical protein IQ15_02217 [Bradyrhizobium yuanmingense]SCB30398.1 hypothetical protein GA0061099_1004458 [Bradyrhizobium yuanmingense]
MILASREDTVALKLRQLCVDPGLFRKCGFQLGPQCENVNRLEPIPCLLDSLVSFRLSSAEVE